MADRKKVIRGLMVCSDDNYKCIDCPYYPEYTGNTDCSNHLCKDALALIEEQRDRIKGLLKCANILSDALDEKEDGDGGERWRNEKDQIPST